ncbi:hypothetical protein [uncultured Ilyobacter sp.]|uniref:hypothetical protein n=1 Tax=uncultured Ilyobacter sp. TaxID=544433 RepID=UPI0029C018DE|nr:hypothetical protein [uncultured Ilyobacter sp.]
MTSQQYEKFIKIRERFRQEVDKYRENYPDFAESLLKRYEQEEKGMRAFVYNEKLDYLEKNDSIKYVWVTDNPGFRESKENKYAVGISGKTGKNFMEENGFVKDFDREVIVLNKSFVHTKVTSELGKFNLYGDILKKNQKFMGELACGLQEIFGCDMWILGTSNLNKIFKSFRETIESKGEFDDIYFYYHFSQGQFKKAYNRKKNELMNQNPKEICKIIGIENRNKLFKG